MYELNEKDVKEIFRKVREIKDPDNDLGDQVAESWLIEDFKKVVENYGEDMYQNGFTDGQAEASDLYDDRYEEGYDDGYENARIKFEVEE